jgi:oligopeptide/dipeptide ABC transporter ATP-binding protein
MTTLTLPDLRKEQARQRIILSGDVPDPADPPAGCRFHSRCLAFSSFDPGRRQRCIDEQPVLLPQNNDHHAACHYARVRQ